VTTRARVALLPPGERRLRIEEAELPEPGPHQVVVRTAATGVCHTQLHQIDSKRSEPMLLGHESAGYVKAVGSAVTHVQPGQAVMLTWLQRLPYRRHGTDDVDVRLPGGVLSTDRLWTWGDHTIVDESYVVAITGETPVDLAAVVGCAVMTGAGAITRGVSVRPGDSVAIFGAGGIGLSAIAAAAVVDADPIIAIDIDPNKLELARQFGATDVVDASSVDPVEAIRGLSKRWDGPPGVHYAFDCVGAQPTMAQIVQAIHGRYEARPGGVAVQIGVPVTNIELDGEDFLFSGRKYVALLGDGVIPERDFPIFLRWHAQKKLDLSLLVSRRYALDEVNDAIGALAAGKIMGRAILDCTS